MTNFNPAAYVEGEPPFPADEFEDRLARTRAEMGKQGIDLLFVTSPPNITWLTGYDMLWYRRATPTGMAIRQDSDKPIFFDTGGHKGLIDNSGFFIQDAVFFARYRDAGGNESDFEISVDSIVDTLKGRGWLKGTAAVERWATAPGAPVLGYLESSFAGAGCPTVDGSWLIDRVRMTYSPRELAVLHHAAGIADEVMRVIHGDLHAGMTEVEIQALARHELGKRGCEEAALRTAVRSGQLRGECHHALPSARPLHRGDIVIVDYSASFKRYHVDLLRCFAIGDCDPRWAEVLEKSSGSVDAVAASVRPGEPMEKVVETAKGYLDEQGIGQYAWFVGGYVQGIAIPPDWVGHVYLGGEGFERSDFKPGMMTNYENVFDIKGWPGGSCISYIDMLEMTEIGIEALSHLPRTLTVV